MYFWSPSSFNSTMGGFSSISLLSVAATVVLLFSRISKGNTSGLNQSVIVVSFDGLSWEFVGSKRAKTPNFDLFASGGVKAKNLIGVHPVKTFPMHVTLMTGLYPESHGIVDNKFWDPLYMEKYILEHDCSNFDPKFYNQSEPIWMTMQKQGRKTGAYYWPGSTSYSRKPSFYPEPFCHLKCEDYKGPTLEYLRLYLKTHCFFDWAKSFQKRIDAVLEWLVSEDPPQLVMLYFEQPDTVGHSNGPNSAKYINQIEALDKNVLGYLVERLMMLQLMDKTNVILLSDHGIIETNDKRQIRLHDYIEPDSYFKNIAAREHIWPRPGKHDEIYNTLKAAENPHFKVYKKEDIPEELHWKNNRRIPPIYLVVEEGWLMRPDWNPLAEGEWVKGSHGWPPTEKSAGIFYARGPAFKKGYKSLKTKRALDVYSLLCHVLGVEPLPNNGTLANMIEFLKDNPSLNTNKSRVVTASNTQSATTITSRHGAEGNTGDDQWYTKSTQVRQSINASKHSSKQLRSTTKGKDTTDFFSMLRHPTKTSITHAQSIHLETSREFTQSKHENDTTTTSLRFEDVLSAQESKYQPSNSIVSQTLNHDRSKVNETMNQQNQISKQQKSAKVTPKLPTATHQIQHTPTDQLITEQMPRVSAQNISLSLDILPSIIKRLEISSHMMLNDETKATTPVFSPKLDKTFTSKTTTLNVNSQFHFTPILNVPVTTDAQRFVATAKLTTVTDSNQIQSAPTLVDTYPVIHATGAQTVVATATLATVTHSNQIQSAPTLVYPVTTVRQTVISSATVSDSNHILITPVLQGDTSPLTDIQTVFSTATLSTITVTHQLQSTPILFDTHLETFENTQVVPITTLKELTGFAAASEILHLKENLTLKNSATAKQSLLKSSFLIVSLAQVDSIVASSSRYKGISSVVRSSNSSNNYTGNNVSVVASSNETSSSGSGDDGNVEALIDCPPLEEENYQDDYESYRNRSTNGSSRASVDTFSFAIAVLVLLIAKLNIWLGT